MLNDRVLKARSLIEFVLPLGGVNAGIRAAAISSLIGTAKLNALDPKAYLRYVISQAVAFGNAG